MRPQWVYVGPWTWNALAAGLTNTAGDVGTSNNNSGITMPWAGRVRAISASTSTCTAGTNTLTVFKNAVASDLTTVLSTTAATKNQTVATSSQVIFAQGDVLDVRATTSAGWAAGNADVVVGIWIEFVFE